ncbi:hypothetical protein [Streptomyces sp. NPDC059489]|uniref:hypothetical protein n=1 Tax=Streptomyces sp. NPDC059489 TaxID=3346849 RepID=UPI0036874CF1
MAQLGHREPRGVQDAHVPEVARLAAHHVRQQNDRLAPRAPSNPDSWGSEAASKRDDVEQTSKRLKPSTLPFPYDHGLPDQARETYSECAFIFLSGRRDDGVVGTGGPDR